MGSGSPGSTTSTSCSSERGPGDSSSEPPASTASGWPSWRASPSPLSPAVRFWTFRVLGIGLYGASVVGFNLKLIELLKTGTCASGNTPYEIARPCPEGTGLDVFLLIASIFGLFISAGVFAASGLHPTRRPRGFAWPLAWWGIFFGGSGAVILLFSLLSDDVPADAELGGAIVGVTFLVMGVPALVFLAMGVGSGFRTREGRQVLKRWEQNRAMHTAPEPRSAPEPPRAQPHRPRPAAKRGDSDERLDKLERLGKLRQAGTLTDAEFEREKARVLAED